MNNRVSLLTAAMVLATLAVPDAKAGGECVILRIEDGAGYGTGNAAPGTGAIVCGTSNTVDAGSGATAMAFGISNQVYTGFSSASGWGNLISGYISYYDLDIRGQENTASGNRNSVYGGNDSAFGVQNRVIGFQSSASGFFNVLQAANESTAVGSRNRIIGVEEDGTVDGDEVAIERASAFGYGNLVSANGASAVGNANQATGARSSAFGVENIADGAGTSAIGYANTATGFDSSSIGWRNQTIGVQSVALGRSNTVTLEGSGASAIGLGNTANGVASTAIGFRSQTNARQGLAMGYYSEANALGALASGRYALADGEFSVAVGNWTGSSLGDPVLDLDLDGDGIADADSRQTIAHGARASAFGPGAIALADDAVAIGSGAFADRGNAVSFGNDSLQRQLVHVGAGTQDTDAVNLSQLYPLATALGGGASYAGGVFTAPTYVIQSNNYNDVGSAFAAVDGAIDDINERIVAVGGIQGEQGESAYEVAVDNGFAGSESDWLASLQGEQGPSGPTGPEGPAGGGPRSVVYDGDDQATLTLGGADGTLISNVANGVAANDAANIGQMQAGDADTLQAANDYTDNTATETLTSANAYTDQRFAELTGLSDSFGTFRDGVDRRFQQQDRRIDKQGSMSSAMLNMAINAAGSQSPRGRVAAGVGFQGGERALSVGYAKRIGARASFSLGGAFSGSEKSAGMGFGVDL